MGRLRVLFVTHTVVMAGANSSMLRLMLELRENYQIEPIVLMPLVHPAYAKRNLFKTCQEQHIECFCYRFYWFKERRNWKSYLKCLSNLLWYPYILWKLRAVRFDVIHSNGSVISLGALLSRVKHTPHVWHLREFGELGLGLVSLLGNSYEKWLYKQSDVFIAISKSLKSYYSDRIPAEKIEMIYNGVLPPDEQFAARHQNSVFQFCMVGLLSSQKNQLESLRAVDILVNRWGVKNFHLSFIGMEEIVYAQELENFIKENSLSDYITFQGESDNISFHLSQMDAGLMLSSFEAFGRVTIEYMMHNLAVIASDSGANQEIVEKGISGFIYHLGDVEELARLMRLLIEDRTRMLSISENGRNRAMKLFTSLRNTQQIYQTYLSVIQKS